MRFNSQFFFRNIFLLVALVSSLLLTACGGGGGGGGGGTAPATSNVTVTIPGSLITPSTSNERAATDGSSNYKLKVAAYSKGVKKTDIKIEDRQFTDNGKDYVANVNGLLNAYDYRFTAFYKNTEILSHQISLSELKNNTNFVLNIDTSLKTLAYDSWKSQSPSNASVENFKKNCEKSGLTIDKDFQKLYDSNIYKQNLEKIINGEKASLPTKKDIDTSTLSTNDLETPLTDIEKACIGTWYLNYVDKYHRMPNSDGDVFTRILRKDRTFTDIDYITIYNDESKSERTSVKTITSIKAKNGLRLSNNYKMSVATGTWSYDSGKLHLKYTNGNKNNDYEEVGTNVVINNNSLIFTSHWKDGNEECSTDMIFKKTKWSTYTEPASATQAIVGIWNLYSRNGQNVDSNTEILSMEFYTDHSCKLPFEFTNGVDKSSNKGTWYYDYDIAYFIPSWGNKYDELPIGEFDFSKQILTYSFVNEKGNNVVELYKKSINELPSSPTDDDDSIDDPTDSSEGKYSQEISSIYSAMNSENSSAKSAEQQFVVYTRASAKYLRLIAKMLDKNDIHSSRISSIYSAMNSENSSSKSAYQQAVAYTRASAKYLDLIATILDKNDIHSSRISSIYSAMNSENSSAKSAIQQVVAYTRGSGKYLDLIATLYDTGDIHTSRISSIYSAMNSENSSAKSAYQQAVAYTRASAKYLDLIATMLDTKNQYSTQISNIYSAMNSENSSAKSAIQQKVAFSRGSAKFLRIIALIYNE